MYGFFWNLIKYKIRYEAGQKDLRESARNIRLEAENLNPVWQKFCQTLACRDDIVGETLTSELRSLLDRCPHHMHSHTDYIIKEEMAEEQFLTEFSDKNLIGSGTIAQVYRAYNKTFNKWVAVKVKHPNIHSEIDNALAQYKRMCNSIWFPNSLKMCADEFFTGLYKQENFELEFFSGKKMKTLLETSIEGSRNSSVFVVPQMIKYSKSIIIMDYEPGNCDFMSIADPKIKELVGLMMIHIQVVSIYHGLLHSDLHWGNFSIRLNPFAIILYDFGWVIDISNTSVEFRKQWAKGFFNRDPIIIFELMIREMGISEIDKNLHINNIKKIINGMSGIKLFSSKFKRIMLYYQMNGLIYNENLIAILYACMHSEQLEKLSHNIPSPDQVIHFLPYAEFDCIRDFL